jgi:hypothetical protein
VIQPASIATMQRSIGRPLASEPALPSRRMRGSGEIHEYGRYVSASRELGLGSSVLRA